MIAPARLARRALPGSVVSAVARRRRPPPPVATEGPSPDPSDFASFGAGSWIVPPSVVRGADGIEIGAGVVVLELGWIERSPGARLVIDDGARLARAVHVMATAGVTIGPGVSTSDYVAIVDTWGPAPGLGRTTSPLDSARVVIERGAYLGCGSVVGPGVVVGEGAFVGEGAVVVDDVPAWSVVYGNPARVVRRWDGSSWIGERFG